MSDYYEKVNNLLKQNNRKLNKSDARSSYFDLISGTTASEMVVFELVNLFDQLQFSACEMWISSREWDYAPISLEEINEIKSLIKSDLSSAGYYSDELVTSLIDIFNHVNKKIYTDKKYSNLDYHIYKSTSKELFCYRRGHELVKNLNK